MQVRRPELESDLENNLWLEHELERRLAQVEQEPFLRLVLFKDQHKQLVRQLREEDLRGYSRALYERLLMRVKKPQEQLRTRPSADSPVLAKIAFDVPVTDVFEWQAFQRLTACSSSSFIVDARSCRHPDSVWLTSMCKDVSTRQEAFELFCSIENDARALCFAWCLSDSRNDHSLLRRSAEMGFGFACVLMCDTRLCKDDDEFFAFAQVAAAQHAFAGHYTLAECFRFGKGCEKDLLAAKKNYTVAAEFGCFKSARSYAELLDESDPAHWYWWGKGLPACFSADSFFSSFSRQVALFFSGSGSSSAVVFEIGHALTGKIDTEQSKILAFQVVDLIGPANQAVSFYDFQIESTRRAVNMWTLISRRLKMIKDMRIFIGKMIWEGRFDASHWLDLVQSESFVSSPVQKEEPAE